MRMIPEFKYWYRMTKAFAVAFSFTFFELFNVPVSRPILVMYFVLLFFQARAAASAPHQPLTVSPTSHAHLPHAWPLCGRRANGKWRT